jgi:hypothetical protein
MLLRFCRCLDLFNALQVELELLALEQIAVGATTLARRRADASEHAT